MSLTPRAWRPLLGISALFVIGAVASSALGLGDTDPATSMDRLRSMPLEHRRRLAANLQQFESLPRDQQRAIRELSAQIEAADPEMRDRYHEVARRYYNWVQTLPSSDREAVRSGDTHQRLEHVHALLARSDEIDRSETLDATLARGSTLNPLSFLDQVHLIRVWLAIDPSQRQELERAAPANRVRLLEDLGRSLGIPDHRPELRRQADEMFRDGMAPRGPAGGPFGPGVLRRFESLKAQTKGEFARRFAEARILGRTSTQPVDPTELNRLAGALPSWIRQSLDALPPDSARERLRLIYRELWPTGAMPAEIQPWDAGPAPSRRGPTTKQEAPPPPAGRPAPSVPGTPF